MFNTVPETSSRQKTVLSLFEMVQPHHQWTEQHYCGDIIHLTIHGQYQVSYMFKRRFNLKEEVSELHYKAEVCLASKAMQHVRHSGATKTQHSEEETAL